MNENLIRVQAEIDLDKAGIVQLAENAFESAWLPCATKDHYIAELKAYAWPLACCSQLFHVRAHMTVQGKKPKGNYLT